MLIQLDERRLRLAVDELGLLEDKDFRDKNNRPKGCFTGIIFIGFILLVVFAVFFLRWIIG